MVVKSLYEITKAILSLSMSLEINHTIWVLFPPLDVACIIANFNCGVRLGPPAQSRMCKETRSHILSPVVALTSLKSYHTSSSVWNAQLPSTKSSELVPHPQRARLCFSLRCVSYIVPETWCTRDASTTQYLFLKICRLANVTHRRLCSLGVNQFLSAWLFFPPDEAESDDILLISMILMIRKRVSR